MLGFFFIVFWLAFVGGWIANIVKFVGLLGGPLETWFFARLVGIVVAPLGALLGWF